MRLYYALQTSFREWQVHFRQEIENEEDAVNDTLLHQTEKHTHNSPIPCFERIQEVTINDDGYLQCSCYHFESTGLPCVHQATVIRSCFKNWRGFTHHDIAMCWWKIWQTHSFDPDAREISSVLLKLQKSEVSGPSFPSQVLLAGSASYDKRIPNKLALSQVKIYKAEELQQIVASFGVHLQNGSILQPYNGGTQQSYAVESNDESEETDLFYTQLDNDSAEDEVDESDIFAKQLLFDDDNKKPRKVAA